MSVLSWVEAVTYLDRLERENEAFKECVRDYFAPCPNFRNYTQWKRHGDDLTDENQSWLHRKGAAKDALKAIAGVSQNLEE